jgi:hypothetical protein
VASRGNRAHIPSMASGWKIIVEIERLGGGPPLKEYYLVAIPNRTDAIKALRERLKAVNPDFKVAGEATPDYLDWLDVRPGEVFCVMAVS